MKEIACRRISVQGRFRDLPWLWWGVAALYAGTGWVLGGAAFYQTYLRGSAHLELVGLGLILVAVGATGIGFSALLAARERLDCHRFPAVERVDGGVVLRAGIYPDSYLSPAVGAFSLALLFLLALLFSAGDPTPVPRRAEVLSYVIFVTVFVVCLSRGVVLLWLRSRRRMFPGDVVLSVEGVSQRVGDTVWEAAWHNIVHAAEAKKTVRGDVLLVSRVVSGPVCRGWGCWWRRWGGVRARDFRLLASPLSFSLRPWESLMRLSRTPEWEEFITAPDAAERVRALFEAESFEDRVWPSYTPFENRGRYMHDLKNLP